MRMECDEDRFAVARLNRTPQIFSDDRDHSGRIVKVVVNLDAARRCVKAYLADQIVGSEASGQSAETPRAIAIT